MKQVISIWLLPSRKDSHYLSEIIKKLSAQYKVPEFIPHLTIYGSIEINFEKAKLIVSKSIKGLKSFIIHANKLNQSDYFWKTVFIEFKVNEYLQAINKNLHKELIDFKNYKLKPHISLIYKELTDEEKIKIIKNLKVKKYYTIDSIAINRSVSHISRDYKKWKILFKKNLG